MSRPRVLCVSSDRSTRASVTLSLTDEPVNVVVAQQSAEAVSRLEREPIDAIVIDASTVTDVPALIEAAESRTPKMPTFVYWGERPDADAGANATADADSDSDSDAASSGDDTEAAATSEPGADESGTESDENGGADETETGTGTDERDSIAVLSQVVARSDERSSSNRLADAITEQLNIGIASQAVAGRIIANARADADADPNAAAAGAATSSAASASGTDRGADADADPEAGDPDDDDAVSLPPDLAWIIDAVRRRLVDATSPAAVERVLREEFMASDRFVFAWVGEYDRGEREIVPWLTDPSETEWPMQRTFSIGADAGERALLERALHDHALRTVDLTDPAASDRVPFGAQAIDRNVGTVAAVPLATDDELYGVFVVYARRGLSDADRVVLRSTAGVASHVLETIAVRGQFEQQQRILQRYERLVETAGDGMYVFDEDGNFMTVNDALVEMTGYSREGLLGEHATFLFDEDDVEAGEEIIESLLKSERSTDTLELVLETKSGETIPCEIQIAVLTHDGEFHGSVGVVRDITERKRQERKLRERNERLDAFARIVSHDLRNPLSVAQGYIDLVEQTGSTEHAENVRDGLDRMETIIDDVLAIARGGEWAAETEPVDLESVASDAWEHVSTAEATLTVTESTTLMADRSRLLRLLENCFRNSVEHGSTSSRPRADDSAERGTSRTESDDALTIRLGTLEDESRSGFFVEDDGTGLPDEIRDEVFDPSVSTSSEGLGIGLWVVREVATGHGWTVTAGESDNGGARFEFETDGDRDADRFAD